MGTSFGIGNLEKGLDKFILKGEEYVVDACSRKSFANCLHENSQIVRPSESQTPSLDSLNLAVDIGGTHTKVALVQFQPGSQPIWRLLFDHENSRFLSEKRAGLPLEKFAESLSNKIRESLVKNSLPHNLIRSVSLVWSNQIEARPLLRERTRGVTGWITGIAVGTYRKNEWFITGLDDGYDLGTLFLNSLHEVLITPEIFLLGNDTVFTLTAFPGSHSGVVASSGGNCTHVGVSEAERDLIFNTEIGSLYKIPECYLSEGELALQSKSGNSIALEDLLSGKWLPVLLEENIITSVANGESNLATLASALQEKLVSIDTRDMREIIMGSPLRAELIPYLNHIGVTERVSDLASLVVKRGGVATAALAYFSLFNQINEGRREFIVSLDSAMARYLPGFFSTLEATLQKLFEKRKISGRIELMKPHALSDGREISVPLIGATFAGALWK